MAQDETGCHFLLFEKTGVRVERLPDDGIVWIGSGDRAEVRVGDPDVLDEHVRIECRAGRCRVLPLGPEAPVRVNDRPVDSPLLLAAGDVLGVGGASLVFQRVGEQRATVPVLDRAAWLERLRDEADRAIRYDRPFGVLLVDLGETVTSEAADAVVERVHTVLRSVDVVGWVGSGEIAALLPETSVASTIPAGRVLDAVVSLVPGVRVGVAVCPDDCTDGESLLVGARVAARAALPGGWAGVAGGVLRAPVEAGPAVWCDPKSRRLFELVEALAAGTLPVLIQGETGVGKEVVARALHAWSPRRAGPFVVVDCGALPETLLENELFGHEKGAFSGAQDARPGLIEAADGGTVFLDEVGESSPRTQAELLRVLDTKRVRRLGSVLERPVDVRFAAATSGTLEQDVGDGRIRRDFYFRISGATLVVPPLRRRRLEIPLLARVFLEEACRSAARPSPTISSRALHALVRHSWPGNVRELRHLMEYLSTVVRESTVLPEHLPDAVRGVGVHLMRTPSEGPAGGEMPRREEGRDEAGERREDRAARESMPSIVLPMYRDEMARVERRLIVAALEAAGGVRVKAAALIDMPLRTLTTKMRVYGLAGVTTAGSKRGRPGRS